VQKRHDRKDDAEKFQGESRTDIFMVASDAIFLAYFISACSRPSRAA
jgi:hypothetical protein